MIPGINGETLNFVFLVEIGSQDFGKLSYIVISLSDERVFVYTYIYIW